PRIGLALGHIFGARDREDRRARGADVVVDRQGFERGERANEDRDVEALDQFLRLRAGLGGIAGSVGGMKLDRPARERIVAFLKKTVRPCSICSPPEASGPVLMVRNPTRSGAACATAAGNLSTCVATPAASAPLITLRRLTVMLFLPVSSNDDAPLAAGAQFRPRITARCSFPPARSRDCRPDA